MDLCIECQASTQANGQNSEECTVAWGACNVRAYMKCEIFRNICF